MYYIKNKRLYKTGSVDYNVVKKSCFFINEIIIT